jgi:hypothetical protein
MKFLGYKMTDVKALCPLCKHENFLVRVGIMRWDWMRCPICLLKLDRWKEEA